MKTVTAWSVNVVWSDGTEEVLADMPSYVSREVDNWPTHLEEEINAEEGDDTYDEFGVSTKNSFARWNTPPKE